MLGFNKAGLFDSLDIVFRVGGADFKTSRFYVGAEPLGTYPTRLEVKIGGAELAELKGYVIRDLENTVLTAEQAREKEALVEELEDLVGLEHAYVTLPFILRNTEHPHTTFKKGVPRQSIQISGSVTLYMEGRPIPKLCDACPRMSADTPCPDFNEREAMSLMCLNTAIFHLPEGQEPGTQLPDGTTYNIDEKGEFSHEETTATSTESTELEGGSDSPTESNAEQPTTTA